MIIMMMMIFFARSNFSICLPLQVAILFLPFFFFCSLIVNHIVAGERRMRAQEMSDSCPNEGARMLRHGAQMFLISEEGEGGARFIHLISSRYRFPFALNACLVPFGKELLALLLLHPCSLMSPTICSLFDLLPFPVSACSKAAPDPPAAPSPCPSTVGQEALFVIVTHGS